MKKIFVPSPGTTSIPLTPLEDPSLRAHLMSEDGGRGDNNGDVPASSIAAAQKGVFEMGTVITQPGLKRADSTELLHLTLHQVRINQLVNAKTFCHVVLLTRGGIVEVYVINK